MLGSRPLSRTTAFAPRRDSRREKPFHQERPALFVASPNHNPKLPILSISYPSRFLSRFLSQAGLSLDLLIESFSRRMDHLHLLAPCWLDGDRPTIGLTVRMGPWETPGRTALPGGGGSRRGRAGGRGRGPASSGRGVAVRRSRRLRLSPASSWRCRPRRRPAGRRRASGGRLATRPR